MHTQARRKDIVIHRIYGRGRVRHVFLYAAGGPQAHVLFDDEPAARLIWLRDCEKEPRPLRKPAVVR